MFTPAGILARSGRVHRPQPSATQLNLAFGSIHAFSYRTMPFPPYHGRALEHPEIVARVRALLAAEWDPAGAIRDAALGDDGYYEELAVTVVGMLAAAAAPPEVQRYLREREQEALGESLHPFDVRRRIAHDAWRAVRGL